MVRRVLIYIFLLAVLGACGKTPGFQAELYDYDRVELSQDQLQDQAKKIKREKGTVVKNSNKIRFDVDEKNTIWQKDELTLKAKVRVGLENFKEVEFKGTQKDGTVLLSPVDPDLSSKLKAKVICQSEIACEDFFIDVFFNDDQVVYHDQILAKPKAKQPTKSYAFNNSAEFAVGEEVEILNDELPETQVIKMGYVGTSDDEIREIFNIQVPKKEAEAAASPSVPQNTPADHPEQAPPNAPTPQTTEPAKPTPVETTVKAQPPNEVHPSMERFRMKNQVFKTPQNGHLQRSTNFVKLTNEIPDLFFFIKPTAKNTFGSYDLARILQKVGAYLQSLMPGRRLAVTEISKQGGGRICWKVKVKGKWKTKCHASHKNGTDADIRYLTNKDENLPADVVTRTDTRGRPIKPVVDPDFLAKYQYQLFKSAWETNEVEIFFADEEIKKVMCEEAKKSGDYKNGDTDTPIAEMLKRIRPEKGHDDHWHIRVKCSPDHPNCEKIDYKIYDVGC